MSKSKLSIRVQGADKANNISAWCKDNLKDYEWDLEPIHLFKGDYRFYFECEKTRIQVILQHL